jgi:hypothetical protein
MQYCSQKWKKISTTKRSDGNTQTATHTAAQPQHEVQRRLFLDVVVGERAVVLELLARKDEALLVRRDALLVLFRVGCGGEKLAWSECKTNGKKKKDNKT